MPLVLVLVVHRLLLSNNAKLNIKADTIILNIYIRIRDITGATIILYII